MGVGHRHARAPGALLVVVVAAARCAPAPCPTDDGAGEGEVFLGLDDAHRAALVEVRGTTDDGVGRCTAFVIGPLHLLSARHCAPVLEAADVTLTSASGESLALTALTAHDALDVALLTLASPSTARPFPLAREVANVVGARVELTGFSREGARPWFAVEPVVELTADELVVDSGGARGACEGDSGAPLLWRGPSGDVEVLGVLSSGSPGCRGRDRYVRADLLDDTFLPSLPAPPRACGALPVSGRCYDDRAVWCAEGRAIASSCAAGCGFDVDDDGYRCVDDGADPCAGAHDLGTCVEGEVVRCQAGTRVVEECDACGGCVVDAASGRARCAGEPG